MAFHEEAIIREIPKRGLTRSTSKNMLFNEMVMEVEINKTSGSSPPDLNSHLATSAPVSCLGHNVMKSSKSSSSSFTRDSSNLSSRTVRVLDSLLGVTLPVKINPKTRFLDLKHKLQSAQGIAGIRIILCQHQRIMLHGQEAADNANVWSELDMHSCSCGTEACLVLQPRITELVAFFLSVFSRPDADAFGSSGCSDGASDDNPDRQGVFDMDMEDSGFKVGECGNGMSTSAAAACNATPPSKSPFAISPIKTPPRPLITFDLEDSDPQWKLRMPDVSVDITLDGCSSAYLSARTTPNSANPTPSCEARCEAFDYLQTALAGHLAKGSLACDTASMDAAVFHAQSCKQQNNNRNEEFQARLLKAIGGGEGDSYSSHLHLILRDKSQSLPLLQRVKLDALRSLVLEVQSGLRHGHAPLGHSEDSRLSHYVPSSSPPSGSLSGLAYGELVAECCGGTYRMRSGSGRECAIFKPVDEEPYAPENPKGFSGSMHVESAMKPGICVGGGAARECAAYLLDHDGMASVPVTAMLYITHSAVVAVNKAEVQLKVGSLQRFHEHECTAEDMGTCRFRVRDVHSVGTFDIRTFNMDRNSDNLLVTQDSNTDGLVKLVPIDHGYILPSCKHLEDANLCWINWPQARQPYDEEMLSYIEALDAEADMELLRTTHGIPEDCLLTLFIGTTLLQSASRANMTLYQTARLISRDDVEKLSPIEGLLQASIKAVNFNGREDALWTLPALKEELVRRIEDLVQKTANSSRVSATFRSITTKALAESRTSSMADLRSGVSPSSDDSSG